MAHRGEDWDEASNGDYDDEEDLELDARRHTLDLDASDDDGDDEDGLGEEDLDDYDVYDEEDYSGDEFE